MGKYSYVSASTLKNDVKSALNELSEYNVNNIRIALKRGALNCEVSDKVDEAFNNLENGTDINGSIVNLKNKLNNLKKAAGYIIDYQDIDDDINELYKSLYNEDGTINNDIQNKINRKYNTLNSYETKINQLLN